MNYRATFGLAFLASMGLAAASTHAAITWDILDRNYGNGSGEVAFNAAENYRFTAPGEYGTESASAGKTTLTFPQDTAFSYVGDDLAMPAQDATIEFKLATLQNTQFNAYLSQTDNTGTSAWNHIVMVNGTYGTGATSDAVADYNARNSTNSAPTGFDGTAPHIYRLVYTSSTSTTSLYLDNNPTALLTLVNNAGAAGDGFNYEFGFGHSNSAPASVDMYYFKVASGAHAPEAVPEPATLSLVGLAGLAMLRRRRGK